MFLDKPDLFTVVITVDAHIYVLLWYLSINSYWIFHVASKSFLLTTGKYTMGRVYHNLLNRSLGVSH